jgi:site-specific DNA-methyltransferase (adenine-specific)
VPVWNRSQSHDWRTPPALFEALDRQYHFTVDAAADADNALCSHYWTEADNALVQCWAGERVFCNPPYGRVMPQFVEKAFHEWQRNYVTSVLLIPARVDTRIWQEVVLPSASITFLKGRLRFRNAQGQEGDPAPFPSAVVVFDGWKSAWNKH